MSASVAPDAPPDAATETIGQRLRRLRLERGLAQRELAEPGVSYAYISRIEAGVRQPSVKAVRLLARKLGVSPHYLETGEQAAPAATRSLRLDEAELELRAHGGPRAEQAFTTALLDARRDGDVTGEIRALAGLGLVLERRGADAQAVAHLEAATGSRALTPLARPDVFVALARALAVTTAGPAAAIKLLKRCLADVRELGDLALALRFASHLAALLADAGQPEEGEALLTDAAAALDDAALDLRHRAELAAAVGRAAHDAGDATRATLHLRRASSLLDASDEAAADGRAQLKIGALKQAERLFALGGTPADVAALRTAQAHAAADAGDADTAIALAEQAISLVDDTAPESGPAYAALGRGRALAHDVDAAGSAFGHAVATFTSHGQWREAATTHRSWASVLRNAGRADEALDVLEQATALGVGRAATSAPRLTSSA